MTLQLRNVCVSAPDDKSRLLLKHIDLALEEGGITLLVGHTGSGKSTLLQVLAGILEPASGTVSLDGQEVWHKGKADSAHLRRLGLTFQFPEQQLFAGSVQREFEYSLRPYRLGAEEKSRRIREACAEFDPDGVFALERSPFSLSGGQQRRLALATTFAAAPDWLLMDEPTAGMEAAAVRDLLRLIRRSERPRGGYVIATHDLDTFLPLADRVIVIAGGAIAADGAPEAICRQPELLLAAGVGLPGCVEVAQAFAGIGGITVPPDALTPERAAAAIAEALQARAFAGGSAASAQPAPRSGSPAAAVRHAAASAEPEAAAARPPQAAWHRVDPRAKWLLYLLLVIAAMLQQHWLGIAAAAVPVLLGFAGLPRTVIRGGFKVARSFLLFMIVSVALAGLQVSMPEGALSVGFDLQRASDTVLNVSRLFLVVIAGYWFAATTPYGQMVQGLGWALRYFKKLRVPVDSFALAVSLIFRFLPLILREWQRFSTIVRARGKASLRPGAVRTRDIPALVVPLLLSLFYKAEEMTIAMELKRLGGQPLTVRNHLLQWARTDTFAVFAGAICFGLLALWRG